MARSALRVLRQLLQWPSVVPGAGCVETHIAALLRRRVRACTHGVGQARAQQDDGMKLGSTRAARQQLISAVDHVASCVETVGPCTLAANGGTRRIAREVAEQLRAAQ